MRIVCSPMAKSIKEHSGGKPVFSSALFYCVNEGYTAAISCATAFLWSCFFHDSWAQAFYSASSLGRAETAASPMCFTSSSYTGERGQSSLPHWPQQPTILTKETGQELCCVSGRGHECRWLQMMILKCLKWFVEMEAALSCLQCKEQWLCFPESGPWIWIQSCSGADLMLVTFYQLGFMQNYISNQNASQTPILAVSLDIDVPWRDGCGTFGDMSIVLCSSLFCNVMDYCISLAWSLGALEIRLVKKEVEGPRELSDEEQTSSYVL